MCQNKQRQPDNNHPEPSDDFLLARCRNGDLDAFDVLLSKYQDRIFNSLLRMVGNYDDALELTQETFVRAIRAIRQFRGNSGFYTWLFRIGMNLAINFHRRRKRVQISSLDTAAQSTGHQADGLIKLIESDDPRPDERAEQNEQYQLLLQAIYQLEPPARAVLVLRDIEQLDYAEIADILSLPIGTVKSRLARARMALRERLI